MRTSTVYLVKDELTGRYLMHSINHWRNDAHWTTDPAEARHYSEPLTVRSLNRIRNSLAEFQWHNILKDEDVQDLQVTCVPATYILNVVEGTTE